MNDALKFVWAYVLEKGKLTSGHWGYYSGDWDDMYPYNLYDSVEEADRNKLEKEKLLNKVKTIGIDWEKSLEVVSSTKSVLEDTGGPSSTVGSLLGTLVLKDGTSYVLGVGNSEQRFDNYVKQLAELATDKERIKRILGESDD